MLAITSDSTLNSVNEISFNLGSFNSITGGLISTFSTVFVAQTFLLKEKSKKKCAFFPIQLKV